MFPLLQILQKNRSINFDSSLVDLFSAELTIKESRTCYADHGGSNSKEGLILIASMFFSFL